MNAFARRASLGLAVVLAAATTARADLRAGELLLIVNKNVPQSAALADRYAKLRDVPAGSVLAVDVPAGEDMGFDDYESKLAKPVRDYLASPAGANVRCLVTFYGIPLRVGARTVLPQEAAEKEALTRLLATLNGQAGTLAKAMDDAARTIGVTPAELPVTDIASGRQHIAETEHRVQAVLLNTVDPSKQQAVVAAFKAAQQQSIAAAAEALGPGGAVAPRPLPELLNQPRDAAARDATRRQVAQAAGVFALAQVVDQQLLWLNGDEADAAVDSELALVRLPDFPRYRWQPNPLNFRANVANSPAIMVCRVDAPTPQIASKMLDDGIATEAVGLDGKAVFDGRGLPVMKNGQPDGYGIFDQSIRDAAAFLKSNTKLDVVADDREAIIPPRDVPGVALYCGWYSLRHYVPSCGFVRGAVGYHVASFELVSLHDPREKGWVANLLKEGVVATLGPVSEPYLASFPNPNEFLPLLLTGKPTLAEAYWATTPMTSWKQTLIGDPLYRPYAKRPQLAVSQLPAALKAWAEKTAASAR